MLQKKLSNVKILTFFYYYYFLEEEAPIDNQPMAIGFTISTAPVWPWPHSSASSSTLVDPDIDLVNSFWSNCPPAARHRRLAHLKSSLHINATNLLQSDEYQTSKTGGTAPAATANATNGTSAGSAQSDQQFVPHPLDLANTDEILRFFFNMILKFKKWKLNN